MPDIIGKVPNSADKMPDTMGELPDNEQEQQIYKYILKFHLPKCPDFLISDNGFYGLLDLSFEMAVEDGIIRKNSITGTFGEYGTPAKEKENLTLEWQEKILKFVEQSKVYMPYRPMIQVSGISL